MSSMSGFTNQIPHKKHTNTSINNLFNLPFIIISFMTHKNSILELILTDTNVLTEEHRYRTNAYRCTKKITRSM